VVQRHAEIAAHHAMSCDRGKANAHQSIRYVGADEIGEDGDGTVGRKAGSGCERFGRPIEQQRRG